MLVRGVRQGLPAVTSELAGDGRTIGMRLPHAVTPISRPWGNSGFEMPARAT